MIGALVLLCAGLGLAAAAATVGAATATAGQAELTRWVSYKLRGTPAAARAVTHPGRILGSANALTTLGVLLASASVPALLALGTPTFLGLFTVIVAVPGFVVLTYLVPRVVGRRWPERIATRTAPWMERAQRLLSPFVPERDLSTRGTLAAVLTGDSSVLAATDEIEVVSGVLAFSDRPVAELMTPRTEIVAIPEGMLAAEAAHVYAQSSYSRYPVYRETLDEIVGVAHAFDLLHLEPDAPVPVRPAIAVPGTRRAGDLMLEMQRGGGHLAVVLDEFGGTAGLVTFEDLLRDLVQEVFDLGEAETPAQGTGGEVVLLDGGAPPSALPSGFGVLGEERGVQTIGGLLIRAIGRIPHPGERFQLRGLEFDVLAATATRVERVAVRRGPVRTVVLDQGEGRA